ncbi:glycoside hydrolase family 19 protein [Flavobacterium sp.]|uniref:glycoside hydrolase family 19 protein n=1 Tax=Flavobacterium sp. TaxID=239 RepID=UPI003751943F
MNLPIFLLNNAVGLVTNLIKYGINTPLRVVHFIAQLHHESGGFTASVEKISYQKAQERYQNHKYLGNKLPGDGYRFRGRGLTQLTGRGNYEKFSKYSGIDIISNPDLASKIDISIQIACWYWTKGSSWGNLNKYADKNDIVSITKGINGGLNGFEDRKKQYAFYKQFDLFAILKKKAIPRAIQKIYKPNYSFYNPFTRMLDFSFQIK